jgi:hypothetical protein
MYRNLKWYFGIGPLMLCSSSSNFRILGAVRRGVGVVDAVMGLRLATFLAGCASKFERRCINIKFGQMLPLDSHSGTFSSPFPSIRSDGNKSQPFLRPFLNRRRRCSASDQIIITVPNKVKLIQKLSILSKMLMRSRAW